MLGRAGIEVMLGDVVCYSRGNEAMHGFATPQFFTNFRRAQRHFSLQKRGAEPRMRLWDGAIARKNDEVEEAGQFVRASPFVERIPLIRAEQPAEFLTGMLLCKVLSGLPGIGG